MQPAKTPVLAFVISRASSFGTIHAIKGNNPNANIIKIWLGSKAIKNRKIKAKVLPTSSVEIIFQLMSFLFSHALYPFDVA